MPDPVPAGDRDQVARPPIAPHPYPLLASVLGQLGYGRDLQYDLPTGHPPYRAYVAARFRATLAGVEVLVEHDEPAPGEPEDGPMFVSSFVIAAHRPGWTNEDRPRWEVTCGARVPLHLVRHIAAAAAQGE